MRRFPSSPRSGRRGFFPFVAVLAGLILIASVVGLVVGLRSDSGPGEQEAAAPAHAKEADFGSGKERDAGARPVAGEHEGEAVAASGEGSERVSAAAELAAQNAYPKGYATARKVLVASPRLRANSR